VTAVETGLNAIAKTAPSILAVSLGFDAHVGDPTANLAATSGGFHAIGQRIGSMGLPTLLVQEGGYIIEKLDENLTGLPHGLPCGTSAVGAICRMHLGEAGARAKLPA
jgi:acetoin utilization deacetylase AcuC-like enzyme